MADVRHNLSLRDNTRNICKLNGRPMKKHRSGQLQGRAGVLDQTVRIFQGASRLRVKVDREFGGGVGVPITHPQPLLAIVNARLVDRQVSRNLDTTGQRLLLSITLQEAPEYIRLADSCSGLEREAVLTTLLQSENTRESSGRLEMTLDQVKAANSAP